MSQSQTYAWLLNTDTGCLFIKTDGMLVRSHLLPYQPTEEEKLIGRKIDVSAEVVPAPEPAAAEPAEEVSATPVETEVVIPKDETEAPQKPAGVRGKAK